MWSVDSVLILNVMDGSVQVLRGPRYTKKPKTTDFCCSEEVPQGPVARGSILRRNWAGEYSKNLGAALGNSISAKYEKSLKKIKEAKLC